MYAFLEDNTSNLKGFTIQGGDTKEYSGGIYICGDSHSNPTIVSNIITDNATETIGGGIYVDLYCSPTIMNNTICGNTPNQVEPDNYPNNFINSVCN